MILTMSTFIGEPALDVRIYVHVYICMMFIYSYIFENKLRKITDCIR